ncbi:MAG: hypothetical protein ACKOXO_05010 [Cyanobium sp.]
MVPTSRDASPRVVTGVRPLVRCSRPSPLGLLRCGPLLLCIAWLPVLPPALAIPAERRPAPPPAPVEHYDPDPQICRPQAIRQAFERQLQPWSDQPEAVLARLRRLQAEMTLATLRRCVRRGLLPEAEALAVARQLQLLAPVPAVASPTPVQAAPTAVPLSPLLSAPTAPSQRP